MAAREVAEYCLRLGLAWDRHYLERAAELWIETAHANQAENGPVDLSANAFQAAIDAATALGDLAMAGRIYGELADLPLAETRRRRYRILARRYESELPRRLPAPAFPSVMRRAESYKEIWRDDLIEWELDGDPVTVMARLIAEGPDRVMFTRPALRALLKFADPGFSATNLSLLGEAAEAAGAVTAHELLRPLMRLFEHEAPEVRAAVMRGRGKEGALTARMFDLVRKALADSAPSVVDAALQLLRRTNFVGAVPSLTRIFRESNEEKVRLAVLDGIGINWDRQAAARLLLDVARQETGAVRKAAEETLARVARVGGEEVATLLRQARDVEAGDRRDALDRILLSGARA
jgi:hypothetical protein